VSKANAGALHQNLKRVPGLVDTRFEKSGTGAGLQLRAEVDTTVFADGVIDADGAYVQINWWPQAGENGEDWYQIHYTDSTGFDRGWHRQPNEHVEGSITTKSARRAMSNTSTNQ